jgi:capsular polysaccharide biosynthesis protein
MAVQIETRGQLQEFLEILRRRSWQVILPASFVLALGTAVAVIIPKKFLVKTQVELRPVGISVSSKEGGNAQFQVKAPERIKKVVQALKNEKYLALPPEKQHEFLSAIQDNIRVTFAKGAEGNTSFVNIEYADVDGEWAKNFLVALRNDWTQDVLDRDRKKLDDEKDRLFTERNNLEKQLGQESEQITDLKRKNNISATQPIPGGQGTRTEDPIYTRWQENQKQLDKITLDLSKLDKKIEINQKRYDLMPVSLKQDELVAGVSKEQELTQIDLDYLEQQNQLKTYRPEHSNYKKIQLKMADLDEKREALQKLITKNELRSIAKPNPERVALKKVIENDTLEAESLRASQAALTEAIRGDDEHIHELQDVYQQLHERQEKHERLQSALADTERRYQEKVQQAKLMQSPLANPFSITEEPSVDAKPTEPNPWLIVAFSFMAGLALGVGLATTLEFSKNCFRSMHEISRVMIVPVLGSINTIVTRREMRLRAARRMLVAVSSVVVIGSVVFVTWAWASAPELLSPDLREKIEVLRSKFH